MRHPHDTPFGQDRLSSPTPHYEGFRQGYVAWMVEPERGAGSLNS